MAFVKHWRYGYNKNMLYDDEQLDDLQYNGLAIIRKKRGFTYGHDAVLLANFLRAKPGERCIDLCAGSGIIAILAAAKTGAAFCGVELQEELCIMANRSAEHNGQAIRFYRADIRALPCADIPREGFDAACCNPPYDLGGTESSNQGRNIATKGAECTIEDVCSAASRLLRYGGRLYICYPASLLTPAAGALAAARLQPKRMAFVRAKRASAPYLVLIEAKKGASAGLCYDPDIILEETP